METYTAYIAGIGFFRARQLRYSKSKTPGRNVWAKLSIIHVLDNIPMPDMAYGTKIRLDENSGDELLETEKSKLKQIGDELGVRPHLPMDGVGCAWTRNCPACGGGGCRSDHCRLPWSSWAGLAAGVNGE